MPSTFVRASAAGSATDFRTSIWAARWKIDVGARLTDRLGDRVGVADVDLHEPRAVLGCLVEVRALAGREVVEDGDRVAAGEQPVDEVRADEARAACH